MIDIVREIEAVEREVGTGRIAAGDGTSVLLRRTFAAPIDDVWSAVTDPERIGRWFLPISGDYRVGGTYQFEGNAGGQILACDAPHRVKVTWVYGVAAGPSDISEVEIRLTATGDESTTLELEHVAIVPDEFWSQYGPGAVGVGWDGAMLGLSLHLRGGTVDDPIAWQMSDEGRAFNTRSSEAWGVAHGASGASPEAVTKAVENSTAFYTTLPEDTGEPS